MRMVARAIKQDFWRARGIGSRKRAGNRRATVTPMCDESHAGAMPAAARQVDQVEVTLAVGSPSNWSTTKIKLLRVLEIPIRITAAVQRVDFFGNARAWGGETGCLSACQDGRFRRRLDRSKRLRWGAAVCSSGGRDGGHLDLLNRYCPHDQEVAHNADGVREATVAGSPPPNVPRADLK
jgi:hypothetical protein